MSKSSQDYTSFATQFPSSQGMILQNVRLIPAWVFPLILVCLCLSVTSAVVHAQPSGFDYWQQGTPPPATGNPTILITSRDNYMGGDARWTDGLFLVEAGGINGGGSVTNTTRAGHLWIAGNLNNSGASAIRYLNNLTIEGDFGNGDINFGNWGIIHDVSHLSVLGSLTNYGDILDGNGTVSALPGADRVFGTLTTGGDLANYGEISNFTSIFTVGELLNEGVISDIDTIVVVSNLVADTPGSGSIFIGEEPPGFNSSGSFRNAGELTNVKSIVVARDVFIDRDSIFDNIGTISAGRNIAVNGKVEGGFRILDAADKLSINGHLTIDRNSIASGNAVFINGGSVVHDAPFDVVNNGILSSNTVIRNEGSILNNGLISAFENFDNYGSITGVGTVSLGRQTILVNGRETTVSGRFNNKSGGEIRGELTIVGDFINENGSNIVLETRGTVGKEVIDVIRVANGTATINGGTLDTSGFFGVAGQQYIFMSTDKPGDLDVRTPLSVEGNYLPGSVLNFAPLFGYWDGKKYVSGRLWGQNNQYYWLEMQRAYSYAPYARTANQRAIGKYLDTIGSAPKQNSSFWNMLVQLDAISDNPANNPYYKKEYATHHGEFNPAALRALDEMSGMIYANLGAASVHNTGVVNRTLADALRSDVFKFSFIGNPNNAIRGQAIAPLRYTRWGTLFGIGGNSKHDGNADGYEVSFGGVLAGVDRALWTGTRVGAYLAVAKGDVTMKTLHEKSDVTSASVGLYLRQEMYYGYGLVTAGFGTDWYKTDRNLKMINHRAQSKTDAMIGTIYLERGIDIPVYYATIQPYTSFQAVSVKQDKFTERMWNQSGQYANVGLEGVTGKTSSFKLALGARASSQPVPLPWGQLAITGNMAWFHDFQGKNDRDYIARFANPGNGNFGSQFSDLTFRIDGNDPKRDWFNLGIGLNMDRNSTRVFVSADLFSNERQSFFSGVGGVCTSW